MMKKTKLPISLLPFILCPLVLLLAGCSSQTLELSPTQDDSDVASESMGLSAADSDATVDVESEQASDPKVQRCLDEHGSHPEAKRIAQEFDQPIDTIVGYFCQRIGFGEIRNGLTIHNETGAELDEILTRFQDGLEWAEIAAEFNASPLAGDASGND